MPSPSTVYSNTKSVASRNPGDEWVLEEANYHGGPAWVLPNGADYTKDFSLAGRFKSKDEAKNFWAFHSMNSMIEPALHPAGEWVLECANWLSKTVTTWLGLPINGEKHPPTHNINEARRWCSAQEAEDYRSKSIDSNFIPVHRPIKPTKQEDVVQPKPTATKFDWKDSGLTGAWIYTNPENNLSARITLTDRFDFQAKVWLKSKEKFNNRGFISRAEAAREAEVFMIKVMSGEKDEEQKISEDKDVWRKKLEAIRAGTNGK